MLYIINLTITRQKLSLLWRHERRCRTWCGLVHACSDPADDAPGCARAYDGGVQTKAFASLGPELDVLLERRRVHRIPRAACKHFSVREFLGDDFVDGLLEFVRNGDESLRRCDDPSCLRDRRRACWCCVACRVRDSRNCLFRPAMATCVNEFDEHDEYLVCEGTLEDVDIHVSSHVPFPLPREPDSLGVCVDEFDELRPSSQYASLLPEYERDGVGVVGSAYNKNVVRRLPRISRHVRLSLRLLSLGVLSPPSLLSPLRTSRSP
mmetsp:Transcript_4537/g.11233  ORF Transcript_4537/g.11233 Transcript_4537/m.11233 type:complete len:265 (-) Transcript_4537:285-1079(-)